MGSVIYMDYHATTPVDPRVVDAMLPYFTEKFGNPASRQHRHGWVAEEAVASARLNIASALHAEPKEVYFTSGATESNNLAIKGLIDAMGLKDKHVITCATEHKSVLDVFYRLAKQGIEVTILSVDEFGMVDIADLRKAIKDNTALVSIMFANNEVGTLHDIAAIGVVCKERGVIFHTDATQAVGKIPIDVQVMNIDMLSLSGHKFYAPKGIGVLYVRGKNPHVMIKPLVDGGGHERGLRSGTLNVPSIVGLAKALELCIESMPEESKRLKHLRDNLFGGLTRKVDDVYLNGHPTHRLSNNLNVSFLGVEDNALMMGMKDVAVASGSACSSAEPMPSHVLKALRIGKARETSAIRFGLGRWTTAEEIEYVIGRVAETVKKLRSLTSHYRPKYTGVSPVS